MLDSKSRLTGNRHIAPAGRELEFRRCQRKVSNHNLVVQISLKWNCFLPKSTTRTFTASTEPKVGVADTTIFVSQLSGHLIAACVETRHEMKREREVSEVISAGFLSKSVPHSFSRSHSPRNHVGADLLLAGQLRSLLGLKVLEQQR